jgi:Tol biopolymer transport system component
VEERQAGERRNLTQTAERTESLLLNPTGASDRLFFCSSPVEDDGAGIHCRLTSVRTDGTGYSVLTDRLSSYPTLSPDGQTIAYVASAPETDERRLWLLPVDGSPRPAAWSEFGLEGWSLSLHAVSWSPGGERLAGWAWGDKGTEAFSGVAVLDLEGGAAHLLPDLNHPVYFDGYPPAPSWSPDGEWLTFLGREEERQTYGTWVVNSRHDEVHALARFESGGAWEYGGRAWSPDGQQLALTRHEDDPQQGIWLVTVGEWELRPVDLPKDARVVTWVAVEE